MITIYPYEELGHAQHGWLDARHHFSFADYHNPKRMSFGALRVINDDVIKAGAGFDTHGHRDMEIITYVRKGAITHRDSQGNEGRTEAGDVQVMSAGKGVYHSEFNLESEETNIYQIWIEPKERGVKPDWKSHSFPTEQISNKLPLLVSGDGTAPLSIQQDAYIHAGRLAKDTVIDHPIVQQAYLLVSDGELDINGKRIRKGDGVQISDMRSVEIKAISNADILIIDVPNSPTH